MSKDAENWSASSDSLKDFDPEVEFADSPHEAPLLLSSIIEGSAQQAVGLGIMFNGLNPSGNTIITHDVESPGLHPSVQSSTSIHKKSDYQSLAPPETVHRIPPENTAAEISDRGTPAEERASERETKPTPDIPELWSRVPGPLQLDHYSLHNIKSSSTVAIPQQTPETDTVSKSPPQGNQLLSAVEQTLRSLPALALEQSVFKPTNPPQSTDQIPDQVIAETSSPRPEQILEQIFARTSKPLARKPEQAVLYVQERPSVSLEVEIPALLIPELAPEASMLAAETTTGSQVSDGAETVAEHVPEASIPCTEPAVSSQPLRQVLAATEHVAEHILDCPSPITTPPHNSAPVTPKQKRTSTPDDVPPAPKKARTSHIPERKVRCEHRCAASGKIPGKQCGNTFWAREKPYCHKHMGFH